MPPTRELAESIRTPVLVPALLQGVARAFQAPQMVADRIAPVRDVDVETGKYIIYGKDDLYTVDNTYAHGAIPNAITSRESEDTFATELRVIRHPLLDKDRNPMRNPNNTTRERRVTTKVTLATQIAREARVAALFTATGNYVSGNVLVKAGAAEWDAAGVINTVQPITDLESRIALVTAGTNMPRSAVSVVVPSNVFDKAIRYNTAIREYYKYTQAGVTTPELLAGLLGIKEMLIATGLFAGSGLQNEQTDISAITTTSLWSDNVWIGIADTDDLDLLTYARQFSYKGDTGGQDIQIRQYRMSDEGQRGDWLEAAEQRDLKLTANFAGALITNTLA